MNTFFDFIRKYNYFFVFLLLEAVSFTLLFNFNSYQGSVWFTAANSAVAEVNGVYESGVSFVRLREVNKDLVHRNVLLQQQNDRLRKALQEAGHHPSETEVLLREQLGTLSLISATVVSNSSERANNYLVIDKGTAEGVTPEMGVVGGGGVVGIVYLTGPHHSLVIPITNRKSSLSCRVRGQSYFGSLQWEGKDLRLAHLDDIPRYAKVNKGEIVETSGYSAVFPPGLFVGRVVGVGNSSDGQSYKLNVRLGTDFATIRDVEVIATPYKVEIDSLKAKAAERDAAAAASGNLPQ
ncbi:MAG: rod shape-determining protein MreC [Alloprevotella sp.]|nr:rod shape-determining protein MreC [Alloprevotella sp.]